MGTILGTALVVVIIHGEEVVVVGLTAGCKQPSLDMIPCNLLSMTAVTPCKMASRGKVLIAGIVGEGVEVVVVITVAAIIAMNSCEFEFRPQTGMTMVSLVKSTTK